MPGSNYPNRFLQQVTIGGVPILQTHPGKVFWVSNVTTGLLAGQRGGSNGNKGDFNSPFSSIAYAITQCATNRGDIIVAKPGHTETVSDNLTLLCNVAGVAIVGMGLGSNRPIITLDTANTASIVVSVANVSWANIWFKANFLSIAACFTLTTAKWFTLERCLFTDTAAATDFLQIIKSTGAANTVDGLTCNDNQWFGTGVTSVTSFALVADANNYVQMLRNKCVTERVGDFPILLTVTTGASLNIELADNVVISKQTASTLGVLAGLGAGSTGVVSNNYAGTLVTSGDILFTGTVGVFPFENRVSGVVGKTGFVIPAVDT